jgi:hypothetical protein
VQLNIVQVSASATVPDASPATVAIAIALATNSHASSFFIAFIIHLPLVLGV